MQFRVLYNGKTNTFHSTNNPCELTIDCKSIVGSPIEVEFQYPKGSCCSLEKVTATQIVVIENGMKIIYKVMESVGDIIACQESCCTSSQIEFPEEKAEIDVNSYNWIPFCVDGVQWFFANPYSVANETGTVTDLNTIYKRGAGGSIQTTLPTGTIVYGYCTNEVVNCSSQFVCNDELGFYDKITSCFDEAGNELSLDKTTTTIPCSTKVVNTDYVCNGDTDTYDLVVNVYNPDGTLNTNTVTPTTISCKVDYEIETNFVCDTLSGYYSIHTQAYEDGLPIGTTVITPTTIYCGANFVQVQDNLVCNYTTGFYDLHTNKYDSNGVQIGATLISATTIKCNENTADIEFLCDKSTNTFHSVTILLGLNGAELSRTIVDTGISCDEDVVMTDYEYVCNATTKNYDLHIFSYGEDGVQIGATTIVPTNILCVPIVVRRDVEYICNQTTGTYDIKYEGFDSDGNSLGITTVPTSIVCVQPIPSNVDVEFICNEVTNVYDIVTTVSNNGIVQSQTTTPTTISCDDQEPKVEENYVCNLVTGTYDIITSLFTEAGVLISRITSPTTMPCVESNFDREESNWLPLCVDGVQWYVRDITIYNPKNNTVVNTLREYKSGADGTISTTSPTGTLITEGECKPCQTECTIGGEGGFDLTPTSFACSKFGFDGNSPFSSICPSGWTPQDLVDVLNQGNPTGATFAVSSGNVIVVTSGTAPEYIEFHTIDIKISQSGGGEVVCAERVKDCNSDASLAVLQEIRDNLCNSTVTSSVICSSSAQTVALEGGGTVSLTSGQELLLGEVFDCKGNIQSFNVSVLIAGVLTEISDPVNAGVCPVTPQVIPTGCIKDGNGKEWESFQTSLNGVTITYYQDAITGVTGTPSGVASSWTNCGSVEIDQYETSPIVYCLNGTTQVLVYDLVTFNNSTATEVSRIKRYIVGGVTSSTAPVGTLVQGSCPISKPNQTHTIIQGVNNSVPAGLKSVTINNLSGITTINGVFQLGTGTRADIITYTATELDGARGLLPAITLAGGTWQWTGLQPINEI